MGYGVSCKCKRLGLRSFWRILILCSSSLCSCECMQPFKPEMWLVGCCERTLFSFQEYTAFSTYKNMACRCNITSAGHKCEGAGMNRNRCDLPLLAYSYAQQYFSAGLEGARLASENQAHITFLTSQPLRWDSSSSIVSAALSILKQVTSQHINC